MQTFSAKTVTIDGVLFELRDNKLNVLLIKRTREPFKDSWALPGGHINSDETCEMALRRAIEAKTSIPFEQIDYTEQLFTFDTPALAGGYAISLTYLLISRESHASDTTEQAFFPVDELPHLAYEHASLIQQAHRRLQNKISYTNIAFALLPIQFSLTELQSSYETILCNALDKRNFRKKFLQLGLIEATNMYRKEGAHRPARLYRFKEQTLISLSRSFS